MSKEGEGTGDTFSRRLLLLKGVGTLGAAAAVATRIQAASATIKISKGAVAYQDHPEGDKRCGKCLQFVAPDSCKMVNGPISPQGFCRIFMPLRQSARPVSIG